MRTTPYLVVVTGKYLKNRIINTLFNNLNLVFVMVRLENQIPLENNIVVLCTFSIITADNYIQIQLI